MQTGARLMLSLMADSRHRTCTLNVSVVAKAMPATIGSDTNWRARALSFAAAVPLAHIVVLVIALPSFVGDIPRRSASVVRDHAANPGVTGVVLVDDR